jgi:hypothetical protein
MKSCGIVFAFGLLFGICGAVPHWNEGDGCMIPAPITGIFMGIFWGIGGMGVGFVTAAMTGAMASPNRTEWIVPDETPKKTLLRPSALQDTSPDTLLRPAAQSPTSSPEELLRASEEQEEAGQQLGTRP